MNADRTTAHGGRDLAIDATRGLAIWSMISLHFANGLLIARPTHSYPLVDGMSAFVLLSGLVLGLVYRRWVDAHSLGYACRRLGRRLVVLYLAQLFLSLTAVLVAAQLSAADFWTVAVLPGDESLAQQLWWAVTLQFLPSGGSILVVYLILMSLAFAVLPALQYRLWPLVLAASAGLYAVSQVAPAGWMVIDSYPGGGPIQNWAAWQILFVPAMVVGWKWSQWRIPARLDAVLPLLVLVTVTAGLVLRHGLWIERWLWTSPDLLGKVDLGLLRVVAAWLAVTTVYAVFRRLLQWMRHDWLRPLVMAGARSLDSYVIQGVALLAIPAWIVFRPWGAGLSTTIVLAVFAVCWGWAEVRRYAQIDRLHRLPVIVAGRRRRTARPAPPPGAQHTHERGLPERAR